MRRIFAANVSILEFPQLARGKCYLSQRHFIVYCLFLYRKNITIFLQVSLYVKIHNIYFAMCNVYLVEVFVSHDSRRSFKFLFPIYQMWFSCMKRNLTGKVLSE